MALIKSSKVRVFPTAWRKTTVNPESALNTEENLTMLSRRISQGNSYDSYVISYDSAGDGTLTFVIHGYWFEITDVNSIRTQGAPLYAKIRIVSDTSSLFADKTLAKADDGTQTRPAVLDDDGGDFHGIEFSTTKPQKQVNSFSLLLLDAEGEIPAESRLNISTVQIQDGAGSSIPISSVFHTNTAYVNNNAFIYGDVYAEKDVHVENSIYVATGSITAPKVYTDYIGYTYSGASALFSTMYGTIPDTSKFALITSSPVSNVGLAYAVNNSDIDFYANNGSINSYAQFVNVYGRSGVQIFGYAAGSASAGPYLTGIYAGRSGNRALLGMYASGSTGDIYAGAGSSVTVSAPQIWFNYGPAASDGVVINNYGSSIQTTLVTGSSTAKVALPGQTGMLVYKAGIGAGRVGNAHTPVFVASNGMVTTCDITSGNIVWYETGAPSGLDNSNWVSKAHSSTEDVRSISENSWTTLVGNSAYKWSIFYTRIGNVFRANIHIHLRDVTITPYDWFRIDLKELVYKCFSGRTVTVETLGWKTPVVTATMDILKLEGALFNGYAAAEDTDASGTWRSYAYVGFNATYSSTTIPLDGISLDITCYVKDALD